MKFNIAYSEKFTEKFWQDSASSSKPDIMRSSSYSYEGLDYEQFKLALNEIVDPPNTGLTAEDIKHDFGPDVSDEFVEKMKNYYNFRKKLYDELVNEVSIAVSMYNNKEIQYTDYNGKLLVGAWEREIPEDCCRLDVKNDICRPSKMYAKINVEIVE